MRMVVYLSFSTDYVRLVRECIQKRSAIFTKQNIFSVRNIIVNEANLSGCTIVWIQF